MRTTISSIGFVLMLDTEPADGLACFRAKGRRVPISRNGRRVLQASACLLTASLACAVVAFAGGVTLVSQKGRAFTVTNLQITRGDTVRFMNEDGFLHQLYVHAPNMNFESDEQEPGTSVDIRFPTSGSFEVRCEIHPKMLLNVTVH